MDGLIEMTCNSVHIQFGAVEWGGTQEHLGCLCKSSLCKMDFVKPCILIVTVDDAIQGSVVLSSTS